MKKVSEKLNCVKKMPELKHTNGESNFDIKESEICQWLIQQPDVLQYIFNRVANNGAKPLIIYNSKRETWQGVDYEN